MLSDLTATRTEFCLYGTN